MSIRKGRKPRPRLVATRFALLLAVALLLACSALANSHVLPQERPSPTALLGPRLSSTSKAWSLYISDSSSPGAPPTWRLSRLDPFTLADTPGHALTGAGFPTRVAGGSRLVAIDQDNGYGLPIEVVDPPTGHVVERVRLAASSVDPYLAADGSRLVLLDRDGFWWAVFDPWGHQVAKGQAPDLRCDYLQAFIDPGGHFLYRVLTRSAGSSATGPVTPILVRNDVLSGKESGRLVLHGILAGVWNLGTDSSGVPKVAMESPGLAVSPNGSRFAILDAGGLRLTVVDLARMSIVARLGMSQPSASLLLSLITDAYAKEMQGESWSLQYSSEGNRLYAWGQQFHNGSNPTTSPLELIDPVSSRIVARGLPDVQIEQVLPSPDGRWLYVTGTNQAQASTTTYLWRLNASNLQVQTVRRFQGGWRQAMILAA